MILGGEAGASLPVIAIRPRQQRRAGSNRVILALKPTQSEPKGKRAPRRNILGLAGLFDTHGFEVGTGEAGGGSGADRVVAELIGAEGLAGEP